MHSKLNTNQNVVHGFEKQVKKYQKAEKMEYAVYIVIDVGGPETRIENLKRTMEEHKKEDKRVPEVILVYAKLKASASNYQ